MSFICAAIDVMLTEKCTYRVTVPTSRAISLWGVHKPFASTYSISISDFNGSHCQTMSIGHGRHLANMTHCPTEAITTERSLTRVPVYLYMWHDWLCVVGVVLNHEQ